MAITVKHLKVSTVPDAGDDTLVEPSDWNADHTLTGLGTMAEQNANAVAITGGTISGVTIPASNVTGTLGVPNGGTGATTLTGYVKGTGTTAMTASATIPNTDITGLGTASTKDAGAANGVATLDAGGKVPVSELPAAVLGALSYQGTWDASTNTPTLTSSVGTKGYYYVVNVAGNTNLNGITDWLVGDWAVYNGSIWQKVDNTETVTSVNGQTGAVVLTTTNVAEGTNEYFTTARARASVSAGTGISYDSGTGVITNTLPSLGGDVVGPSVATDNAIARFDTTTGKLIQNSTATVSDAGLLSASSVTTTGDSTIHGLTVGKGNSGVANNTAFGVSALAANTTGQQNVGVGTSALSSATTANNQVAVGYQVLRISTASDNTGVGSTALQSNTSGGGNVAVGFQTLTANTTGGSNTAIGRHALITNSTGSNITALGNHAGAYETGSNALYIDAYDRTNTAGDKAGALLYGTFNATPSSQTLTINGQITLPYQTNFNAAIALTGSAGTSGQVLTSAGAGATPTWSTPTTGTVTSVTGTSPVVSSGGNTPAISMPAATTSVSGYLTSTDWNTFNNKSNTSGTVTSVGGTGTVNGISLSGTVTSSGNLTLGGALTGVSLDTQVTGTLPIANGGTGATVANGAMANLMGFTSTATAGGTTTLTNTSSYYQLFTGTLTQTIVLPVTSTLQQGWTFHICNNSTGNLTITTSGGNTLFTVGTGLTLMVTCIATGGTGTADWEAGFTDFSSSTGSGSVVLATSPSISGTLTITSAINANTNTATIALGTAQTTGLWSAGGASGTGTMTLGQSTVSQTTNIQAGATASGSTKTVNLGTGGLSGSTTAIAIGSTAGTSTTTVNGVFTTPVPQASNGLVVNSNTVSASYTIPTGSSASSVGPMTVASGQTVTVPSGSRWVVL
jgi:hypothetical protein